MDDKLNIRIDLIRKDTKEPLRGDEFRVEFYDEDLIKDDFLGETRLDNFGHASISIYNKKFRSLDSPAESKPDIFFRVFQNEKEIYKSPVFKNIQVKEVSNYSDSGGLDVDLGTFLI
ncbi:hypothetical protein OO013_08055 [Mangrovivirga sp. M17]|uniref:Uncharacterized protein n=1 Tax=Mangrovivirga halotolerans TaxID=2993936 RepID=A0ABT3RR04_9BACT|nr:hypothetical protein [Mangrovivirga halotolerans]MCX2743814.1 hypothetical protein [Mangrovivirga halotolerans]